MAEMKQRVRLSPSDNALDEVLEAYFSRLPTKAVQP